MGWEASFSPEGKRIAYVPLGRAFTVWKRYRGGRVTPIWLAELSNSRIEKVSTEHANDFCPMWVDDHVFFLSDRNGIVTLAHGVGCAQWSADRHARPDRSHG